MSQYFAGIAPTSVGFSTYHVFPQMGSLKKISAKVISVKGEIGVKLTNASDAFSLELNSPAGTQAAVGIPVSAGGTVAEVKANGKVVWKSGAAGGSVRGVRFVEANSRYLIFAVEPGAWVFNARR